MRLHYSGYCETMIMVGESRVQCLLDQYGELLTTTDLAEVFRYSSAAAVRQAHAAGRLPVKLRRFPNRRGWFATARTVAAALDRLDENDGA